MVYEYRNCTGCPQKFSVEYKVFNCLKKNNFYIYKKFDHLFSLEDAIRDTRINDIIKTEILSVLTKNRDKYRNLNLSSLKKVQGFVNREKKVKYRRRD